MFVICPFYSHQPTLIHRRHLRPGTGWFEQIEIDIEPRCDDGTLPPNNIIKTWYDYLCDATVRANRPIAYQHNTRQLLQAQGFVDIDEQIIRLPLSPWPADSHQKEIGRWYNLGMSEGLEALSLGPFTRCFRWSAGDARQMAAEVKVAMCSRKIHVYNNL